MKLRPQLCVTFHHNPPRGNEDIEIARAVTHALGLEHVILPLNRSRLDVELRKNRLTSFCSDEHSQYLVLADYFRNKAHTVYDGLAGDILSGGDEYVTADRHAGIKLGCFIPFAEELAGDDAHLRWLLASRSLGRLSRSLAIQRLAEEVASHSDEPNPVISFFFWNATRREIAQIPFTLYSGVPQVICPYIDRELFDFITTLPPSMLIGTAFHTEVIRKAYPQYAHIPFERECWKAPGKPNRPYFRRLARDVLQMMSGRPSNIVTSPRRYLPLLYGLVAGSRINRFSILAIYLLQLERAISG
jgi:hypothetical protein